ncbi:MAG TPA: DUF202 domain-containing protein [Kiritimatiellia bacterium]|nr:DUF202 domain-containing protein [Kiritimatiellia bacterium]
MSDTAYARFEKEDLILRDELAVDRTLLANERTLLAYLRSAVALVIAGVSIVHFAPEGWFRVIGLLCVPTGLVSGVIGVVRFRKMNRAIGLLRNRASRQTGPS